MRLKFFLGMGITVCLGLTGCSSQISFTKEEIQVQQMVKVVLRSGESVKGEVEKLDAETIVVRDYDGKSWQAKTHDIFEITGPEPVFDFQSRIISEAEIAKTKKSSNTWMYVLGGGLLSLGGSFFLGNMVSRAADEDTKDGIVYGVTGAGTTIGTYLFAKKGSSRDRLLAISKIRQQRNSNYTKEIESEKAKKQQVEAEIARLKKEREQQDAEIAALKKKLKSNGGKK